MSQKDQYHPVWDSPMHKSAKLLYDESFTSIICMLINDKIRIKIMCKHNIPRLISDCKKVWLVSVNDKYCDESVNDKYCDESVNDKYCDESVNDKYCDESVNDKYCDESVNDKYCDESVNDKYCDESVNDKYCDESVNDKYCDESVNDKYCDESVNDNTLPMTRNNYKKMFTTVAEASKKVAMESMVKAVTELREILENSEDNIADCYVSVDGTWQRKGHSSHHGVVTAISVENGKCIDTEILSKYCPKGYNDVDEGPPAPTPKFRPAREPEFI
nr:putative serine/threonine-protein kinase kinX [Biomphalaria glabrata]